jgi:hypothetical protein
MKSYKVIEDGIEYVYTENSFGDKIYYLNNQLHRENGPAVEYSAGDKSWYKHGKHHREDGPAKIYQDGTKQYWLNDERYYDIISDEEWIKLVLIISIIT